MSQPGRELDFADAPACERAFYQAFAEHDLEAMGRIWDEAEVFCIHPGSGVLRTREEVLASWKAIFEDSIRPSLQVQVLQRFDGEDLAVHLVREHITHAGRSNTVLATNVYRRHAGYWRLSSHHGSVSAKRAEAPEPGRSLH